MEVQVDQLRWRQRRANQRRAELKREVEQLEEYLAGQERRVAELQESKSSLRVQIKRWKEGFETTRGRPPTDADRDEEANALFLEYQRVSVEHGWMCGGSERGHFRT